jgi:hypothetical protein
MGIAGALCAGAYYTYNAASTLPEGKGEVGLGFGRFYLWDEYNGGTLNRKHYLGRALEAARPLPGQTGEANVLQELAAAKLRCLDGYEAASAHDAEAGILKVEVRNQPDRAPANRGIAVTLPFVAGARAAKDKPFTLTGEGRARPGYERLHPALEGAPASVGMALGTADRGDRDSRMLLDGQWWAFSVVLYARSDAEGLSLLFGEEPGAFEFRNLALREGNGFVLFRRFENGIALMNGSDKPVAFDLGRLDPERKYRAIEGTITPAINDGRPIEHPVTLEPFDGRVLVVDR